MFGKYKTEVKGIGEHANRDLEEFEVACEEVLADSIRALKRDGTSRESVYKWLSAVGANHVRRGEDTPANAIATLNRLMWVYDEA